MSLNAERRVASAAAGAALHVEALGLLRRERSLWKIALVPFLLSSLALLAALAGLIGYAGELHGLAAGWLPDLQPHAWYAWLWVGPVRLALWVIGGVLFLALCVALLIAAWLIASIVAAPFHDELSRRVEAVVTGEVEDRAEPGIAGIVREGGRAVIEELRRTGFFLAVQAGLLATGILVPGGQAVAPAAMTLFTILFLPLDYASHVLDRRQVPFRQKRRWVAANRAAMLGFGATAFATFLVPGLNFLAMPVLVVSGTLLALRTSPQTVAS